MNLNWLFVSHLDLNVSNFYWDLTVAENPADGVIDLRLLVQMILALVNKPWRTSPDTKFARLQEQNFTAILNWFKHFNCVFFYQA